MKMHSTRLSNSSSTPSSSLNVPAICCVYRIYQLWKKVITYFKTCKVSFYLPSPRHKCIKMSCVSLTSQKKAAERWKIAYQIEAIRLNCSHKYCFSHASLSYRVDSLTPLLYRPQLQCVDFANEFFVYFLSLTLAYASFCLRCFFSTAMSPLNVNDAACKARSKRG